MEHPADTLGVPPLLESSVVAAFCQAVQHHADSVGRGVEAATALAGLRDRLESVRRTSQLCRLALLGHPRSVERLRDELHCLATDFPGPAVGLPESEIDGTGEADPGALLLPAVIDLFAGAAFVSKAEPSNLEWLIGGLVRAIEAAVCFPLAFGPEALAYLGGSSGLAGVHAAAVIATVAGRLIGGEACCDPPVPSVAAARLGLLARRWLQANPVTEMLQALSGPRLGDALLGLSPHEVQVGDRVTLSLRPDCSERPILDRKAETLPRGGRFVLFCPAQPARVLGVGTNSIEVVVPDGARSGPVALVRQPELSGVRALLARFACQYPVDWPNSLFGLIPMWKWAYPAAYGPPRAEIRAVPARATVKAFSGGGALAAGGTVALGQKVYIHYLVDPPGSDQAAPLEVTASLGQLSYPIPTGMVVYTASQPGDDVIELKWGALSESVTVRVAPSSEVA